MGKARLMIGSCICQSPRILERFLNSVNGLELSSFDVSFLFYDDNQETVSSEILRTAVKNNFIGNAEIINAPPRSAAYYVNEETHFWSDSLVMRVGAMKNEIIKRAADERFDYLFLIDSDLLVDPGLVNHLEAQGKNIVCEIFWTSWQQGTIPMPNAWMFDKYEMAHPSVEPEKRNLITSEFFETLKKPGLYEVGGLGACTLISHEVLAAGVNFSPIKNVSFWGEDRWFCIRAAVHGFPLYIDTHYPARHLYRESDLN